MEHDSRVTLSVQSLLDERHTLSQRSLSQPTGSGQWVGSFSGIRRGHGTDFDDLRHYTAGDELRHIDWKASARTNTLHTRLYREEKEHRVTIVADIRTSMFAGSTQLRAVHACRLAARMLWQSVDNGSRASVIVLTDESLYITEHATGHKAAIQGCGLLARRFLDVQQSLQNKMRSYRKNDRQATPAKSAEESDTATLRDLPIKLLSPRNGQVKDILELDSVMHWLLHQPQKTHSLLWVTGMDDCGECFEDSLVNLCQLTTQAAVYIDDPMLSKGLPSGRYGYLSRGQVSVRSEVTLSHQATKKLHQALQDVEQQLRHQFERLQIPFLSTSENDAQIISSLRQFGYLP